MSTMPWIPTFARAHAALAVLVAAAPLGSGPAGPAGARGPDWHARYAVVFAAEDDGSHRAEVEAHFTWQGGRGDRPDVLELSMAGGYPGGYGRFVEGFEAVLPDGAAAPREGYQAEVVDGSDAEGARYRVPVLRDGRAAFRYRVRLAHDPAEGPGWDETPHAFSDGVLWTGRALFPTAAGCEVEVELTPPDGAHVSTSLEPGERDGVHRAPSGDLLRETYLLVGEHWEREIELEGTTLVLAVDGELADAAELVASQVRGFVEAGIAMLGGPPPARCLVAITRSDDEGGGAVLHRDAHVLMAGPPAEEATGWRVTLCHELFHLWNSVLGFDSREMWFSEGFTDYWASRLLARTGDIDGALFLEHARAWASAYVGELRRIEPIGLREAGALGAKNRTLVYEGGALAALCMDVAIRAHSDGDRSLDDVMGRLYALCADAGGQASVGELDRLLAQFGGRALRGFLDRHVAGAEPLPLAETLELAGLALETRSVSIPEMEALGRLLQCPGMTVVPAGIEINRTDAGKLKVADVLLELAGRPVTDFGDVRRALADREPGDQVDAVVLRGGARKELALRLGGHGAELPRSVAEETRLVPITKAKRRAREIRAALFGDALR